MSDAWLEYANGRLLPGLLQRMGVRFTEADEEHVVAEMESGEQTALPNGFYFGGALLSFADAVAGALSHYEETPPDAPTVLTTMPQLNVNIMRNSQSEKLLGEARWLRRGRSVMVVDTRIYDSEERLLLQATSTHVPVSQQPA